MNRYEQAKQIYQSYGIDTELALEKIKTIPISVHCWQGDDVTGFEQQNGILSGGIQATGNYPGKARNFDELKQDLLKAFEHIPGKKRLNLHAMYYVWDEYVERDQLEPKHFDAWIDFALENNIHLDFNPTFFSSPYVKDNLTLSSPDEEIRAFWVRHGQVCRKIASYIGERQGSPCLCNIWIPDGFKDIPVDRFGPRQRLKKSLDEIYSIKYDKNTIIDAVESKVFGIGLESYTVGSSEFYMNYAKENNICCLIDNGHYHPTENVADKISSMVLFYDYVAFHVTRPVRWDSDHIIILDDVVKDIAKEIVASNELDKFLIGLDYFDASVNRVAAWVIGTRNFQKALLQALLIPFDKLTKYQDEAKFTELLAFQEEIKVLPFYDVWNEYLRREEKLTDLNWLDNIKTYEEKVLKERI